MEILHCEQGSVEWHLARLGIPTASEFKSIMAKGEGKTRRTYMMKLLGERFTGEPADTFTNVHMERGKDMEDEARRCYAFMQDADPVQVGFIINEGVGCSPDSLIGDAGMMEIKTKLPHLQLDALLADKLPSEHKAQVQGQMWVAEREWCDFVAYWPHLPLFVKRIERDDEYIATIQSEVTRFLDEMNELQSRLVAKGATVRLHLDNEEQAA